MFIVVVWLLRHEGLSGHISSPQPWVIEQQIDSAIWMASHLVTSELVWPFIFELWPWLPHKWRYNILPFIPPLIQSRLNFGPGAFHRNVFQDSLSFDLEQRDRLWLSEKVWGLSKNIFSWFYLCMRGKEGWLRMLTRLRVAGNKTSEENEKVCHVIKRKVNKHLNVIRKQTAQFYKKWLFTVVLIQCRIECVKQGWRGIFCINIIKITRGCSEK